MDIELSPEQINQIARAARVLASGFTEEQLRWLISCQRRLADSGFCEAAWGLAYLEAERGLTCAQALDACDRLLQDRVKLEAEVARLKDVLRAQQGKNRQAEESYQQLTGATEQAERGLAEVEAERERAESELAAFHKKAARQKKDIDRQVEQLRQRANMEEEEIASARQLKSEVESSGFSLELMLSLSMEFAGHRDAREGLAEALRKHRSLTEHLAAVQEQAGEQKTALKSELASLQSQRDRERAQVKSLEETRKHLETVIAQLRADIAGEEELSKFYLRYQGLSGLMDCLASWDQVIFLRCNNPVSTLAGVFDPSARTAHIWTDKPATRCPHCGLTMLNYDEKPYQAINWPVGAPLKLYLGG